MIMLPMIIVRLVVVGSLLAVTLAPGCSRAQGAQAANQQRLQARLEKEVRHVLVTQPFYSVFDNLAYKVDGDRVTLLGQVVQPTLKSNAAAAVKSIEGVSAVDNEIEVLPVSPSDDRIRRAEFRAIYSAPGMEKYSIQAVPPIHIIVKNGHVTLVGVVASGADKILANARAQSVPGVFSVTNQLTAEK
jgi:hyperosmotically inducible periplasmic protein